MTDLSDEDFLNMSRVDAQGVYDRSMVDRRSHLRAIYLERHRRDLRAPSAAEDFVSSVGRPLRAAGLLLVVTGILCIGYGLLMDVSVTTSLPSVYGLPQEPVANFDKMAQRELSAIIGAAQLVAGSVLLGAHAIVTALGRLARHQAMDL